MKKLKFARMGAVVGCTLFAASWNVAYSESAEPVSCDNISDYLDCTSTGRQEDIVFAFDTTGSMGDEIAEMQHAVIEFSDAIAKAGIDYNLGLTEYKDFPLLELGLECGEPDDVAYTVHNGGVLTDDNKTMSDWIKSLKASGGNDVPEALLAALAHTVTDQQWRADSHRIAIIITDAPPHPDGDDCNLEDNTLPEVNGGGVIEKLLLAGIVTHVIGPDESSMRKIANKTGGTFFDIEEIREGKKSITDILGTIAKLISCTYRIRAAFGYKDNELNIETRLIGKDEKTLPHVTDHTRLTVTACRQDGSSTPCPVYDLDPETITDETVYKQTADVSALSDPADLTDLSTLVKVCDFSTTTKATLHIGECVDGETPAPNEPVLKISVEGKNAEASWGTDPFARGYNLLYAPYSCPMGKVTLNNVAAIPMELKTGIASPLASGTNLYVGVQASNCSGLSPITVDMENCSGSSSLGEVHIPVK
jgi:hypothetical protein